MEKFIWTFDLVTCSENQIRVARERDHQAISTVSDMLLLYLELALAYPE